MGEDEALRLNRLARYRKTSARLALEVHSHCEVPAGCGGAVLRWRTADGPVGVITSLWTPGEVRVTLNGAPLPEQRAMVSPGEHVLAAEVELTASAGFIIATVILDPSIASAVTTKIASPGGRWRGTRAEPPPGWERPGFVEDAWETLVVHPTPRAGKRDWKLDWMARSGACMGFASTTGAGAARRAFVRWTFSVGPGGFQG